MTLTIAAVAAHKKIDIQKNRVDIRLVVEDMLTRKATWAVDIDLGSGLTKREQTLLFNSARSCEVHKVLGSEATFDFKLAAEEPRKEAA